MKRQFELVDGEDQSRLVCWLDDDPRLTLGRSLTLKQTGARLWAIAVRYDHVIADGSLNRGWKVGGIA